MGSDWYISSFLSRSLRYSTERLTPQEPENTAIDLETFSRHAGRSTISTDDVLLIARRNEALHGIMREFVESEAARPKKDGVGKKKSGGGKRGRPKGKGKAGD